MILKNKKKIFKISKGNMPNSSFDSYIDQKLFNIALKFINLIKKVGALESKHKDTKEKKGRCEILLFKNKIDK